MGSGVLYLQVSGILSLFLTLVQDLATPKEDEELKFSSPTLKSELETSIASKAHRQIIVCAAIKAGAHSSWAIGQISLIRSLTPV